MVTQLTYRILTYEVYVVQDVNRFLLLIALALSISGFALAFLTGSFPLENPHKDAEEIK